jgi:hypothetical protein
VTIDGPNLGADGTCGPETIELNGAGAGAAAIGLDVAGGGGGTKIIGLVIDRFGSYGVRLGGGGNFLWGNIIGTDSTGAATGKGNISGVYVVSANNQIDGTTAAGPNVISGNTNDGVQIDGTGGGITGNIVKGNYIGLTAAGTAALKNGGQGIIIYLGAFNNTIGVPGAGNVISGNGGDGIRIFDAGSTGNLVQGNLIGTNAGGNAAVGNTRFGVIVGNSANNNTIGGTAANTRNVISGNTNGVVVSGPGVTNNFVQGNYLGTNAAGTAAIPNTGNGVELSAGAAGNTIGGTTATARNVISGNGTDGMLVNDPNTNNNVIAGNYIGTNAAGTAALGNGANGIIIFSGAPSNNTIGGTAAGAGNVIAFNTGSGIRVNTGTGNGILGNSIHDNTGGFGLGIDLNGDGLTQNNTVYPHSGANNSQNHPVLSAAMTNGAGVATIAGSLNGTANTAFRIEFFANTNAADVDGSGYGEGRRFLAFANVSTPVGNNNAVFGVTLTTVLNAGEYVTATATDPSNNTSEFGNNVQAVGHLVVTTTSDSTTGSNTGSVSLLIANPGTDGRISLREALLAVDNGGVADTITFGIPLTDPNHLYYKDNGGAGFAAEVTTTLADSTTASSPGIPDFDANYPAGLARSWYRIQPALLLPAISVPLVLDATTQPGYVSGGPVVEIVGTSNGTGAGKYCFAVPTPTAASTIRGFVINMWGGEGVTAAAASVVIRGNYIGTDVSGTVALGNGRSGSSSGVYVGGNGSQIGGLTAADRNVISGNLSDGLWIDGNNIVVQGNYIGTNVSGAASLGNAYSGVVLSAVGSPTVSNVTVGGVAAGSRNVIAGNTQSGMLLSGAGTQSDFVQGNYIGTNAAGTAALPNGQHGIWVRAAATGNTIGGTSAAPRNVISGNASQGVRIDGAGTTNNAVSGNYVGTDAAGTTAIANGAGGVAIVNSAANNTVGGVAAGSGNLISGNTTHGVLINGAGTDGNTLARNLIGTDATGTLDLGNTQNGVLVSGGAKNNAIGAASPAGNVISGNNFSGVDLTGVGTSNNTLIGNIIGLDVNGAALLANTSHGVQIDSGASSNTVGGAGANGNVISGNGTYGVNVIGAGSSSNVVIGNILGLDVTGTLARGNVTGISVGQGATANVVGQPAGGGNVISGNSQYGVRIVDPGTNNNLVQNNYIGTDVTGALARGNTSDGVRMEAGGAATGNVIGGTLAGYGNVISGNGGSGVHVRDSMTGNVIAGNTIGTNAAGTAALPNAVHGVYLLSSTTNNTVGGTTVTERNLISGNGSGANCQGVRIDGAGTTGNVVRGNYIGTNAAGTAGIPNTAGGVAITNSAANNTLGGTAAGAGNLIAFNTNYGINVAAGAGTGNAILGNAIHSNTVGSFFGLGIDLNNDGVTSNDLGDVHVGPNGQQNFPVLSAAMTNGAGNAAIAGSLHSLANTTFRIEFFASSAAQVDPTGFGEGARYLGFVNVSTPAGNNNVAFGVTLATALAAGEYVTATATDPSNNTSEFSAAIQAYASVIVTTTADTVDGNTASVSALIANPGADGRISLREAITAANNTAGADTIRFGIPLADANHLYYQNDATAGSLTTVQTTPLADALSPSSPATANFDPDYVGTKFSWYRIQPTSALPTISGAVTIDGYTQPGAQPNTVAAPGTSNAILDIELDGNNIPGAPFTGLDVNAASTIRGLVINRFGGSVGSNFVGILVRNASGGSLIAGNYVGTDVTGTIRRANQDGGISVVSSANNTIGGTTPADRNLISGNRNVGLQILNAGSTGNVVVGNFIGTDVRGTGALGNWDPAFDGDGLRFTGTSASGNTIGGTTAGARNVISGNEGNGIAFQNGNNNVVQGNYIGTNAAGTAAVPNGQVTGWGGLSLGGTNNQIGGTAAGAGNVMSGNLGAGVGGAGSGHTIQGNFIGTDATGSAALPNSNYPGQPGFGVDLTSGATNIKIGGTVAGAGNTIAFNAAAGIGLQTTAASGNAILGNKIYSNGGLGIDLNEDGVTANDALDGDTGPNGVQNFPVVTRAFWSGGTITVNARLDLPAGSYRIEFFKNTAADPTGNGEGQTLVATQNFTHPGGGLVWLAPNPTFAGAATDYVTATATRCTDGATCAAFGDTSEFSNAMLATTTAVTLASFSAGGADRAVDVSWTTASELSNLGFHLYRSLSASGPFARVTSAVIPGLGSSAVGTSYSYRDSGLANGVTYYYKLEDIDTSGITTLHGPVWATTSAKTNDDKDGDGDSSSSDGGGKGVPYGDPEATSLTVLERDGRHVLLELRTGGFYAAPNADGTVDISVPGFDLRSSPGDPALPARHTWLEATAGRKVRITSVQALEPLAFRGLRPAAAGLPTIDVSNTGVVRPARSLRREAATFRRGLFPSRLARVLGTGFQGETKKAQVELSPLRFNPGAGQLLLTRRLLVRLDFVELEPGEISLGGTQGRRPSSRVRVPASGLVAQLAVATKGLYRIAFDEVLGPTARAIPLTSLSLTERGQPVAYHVDGPSFGPGSSLYFVSAGPQAIPDLSELVYELRAAAGGLRMEILSAAPSGPSTAYGFSTLELEQNKTYQSGLLDAPDLWLWDVMVSPVVKSYPFAVDQLASTAEPGQLTVDLQGASDFDVSPDHHVRVSVNGAILGEATWDAKTAKTIRAPIPQGVLVEGANTLQVENVGDTPAAYSMVILNRFSVSYPRLTTAASGRFESLVSSAGTVEVSGFDATAVLLDATATPRWLVGQDAGPSGLRFRAEAGHRYVAVAPSALLRPEVRHPFPADLRSGRNRADYVVVAPRSFLEAATPLLDLRESQGLKTRAVAIEDVYDQFGFGEASPAALKEFLSFAFQYWQRPSLRYVLLLGDATYDPKNHLKTAVVNRVPPFMVKTSYLWTASDAAYAAVNGDDSLPDLAVGRLPAETLDEARVMVDKVVAFESSGRDFSGPAVLIADNADVAGNFEQDADDVASSAFASRPVEKLYLRDLGGGTRAAIQDAFDQGPAIVNYIGHGGIAVWASENVWNNTDVASLSAQPQQPLLFTMNCLNGYFHFPNLNSVAEQFLKAEGKGAVAAFAPSGLSVDDPAHHYHKLVLHEITSGRHERLGDAVLAAQAAYAASGDFPELLSIYHLFGDPALEIR